VTLGKDLPPVTGWGQRIEQVAINLLQNACQALPDPEAAVRVSTGYDAQGEKVWICVADEGEGIPPEDLPHVTDPFFTTKREQGGTGLGLSISARIVADHGGELSLGPNESGGVDAWVHLPVRRSGLGADPGKAEET
jgi:polar amino acid transport system substrate-binding protein